MDEREELENQGFKVNDRRRFDPEGNPVAAESAEEPAAAAPAASEAATPESEAAPRAAREIPADFSSLVLSLAAGAQAALGIAPHPVTGKLEKNLSQAKYSIDLLGMLQEKTRGNLSPEEAQLMEALLYDLRLRYVEAKPS